MAQNARAPSACLCSACLCSASLCSASLSIARVRRTARCHGSPAMRWTPGRPRAPRPGGRGTAPPLGRVMPLGHHSAPVSTWHIIRRASLPRTPLCVLVAGTPRLPRLLLVKKRDNDLRRALPKPYCFSNACQPRDTGARGDGFLHDRMATKTGLAWQNRCNRLISWGIHATEGIEQVGMIPQT